MRKKPTQHFDRLNLRDGLFLSFGKNDDGTLWGRIYDGWSYSAEIIGIPENLELGSDELRLAICHQARVKRLIVLLVEGKPNLFKLESIYKQQSQRALF